MPDLRLSLPGHGRRHVLLAALRRAWSLELARTDTRRYGVRR